MTILLELKEVEAGYGQKSVLFEVSLEVKSGDLVALIGPNGAGKTTTLGLISGQIHPSKGAVLFDGKDISRNETFEIARKGVALVPQGGKVFRNLTVVENLEMGGYLLESRQELNRSINKIYSLFPILQQRKSQMAQTLSGGEQQMLAVSRGLMTTPKLLMLDEPSMGLAPITLRELMKAVANIKVEIKNTILIVEQNVKEVLKIADRVLGMKSGELVFHEENPELLLVDDKLRKTYLA